MATVDWIMMVTLAGSILLGAWRGLVFEVLSVAGWVLAFIAAQWYGPQMAAWLPMAGASESMRHAAGFGLLFVLVLFASAFTAWVVKKMIQAVGLRPIDRILGAAFGAMRGLLLLLAATLVVGMTPLKTSAAWQASVGAPWLAALLVSLRPLLPGPFAKHIV